MESEVVMPCFIKINSSNLPSRGINDHPAYLELRQAQCNNNESAMQHRTENMFFDMVTKLQMFFDSKELTWCTSNINSLKRGSSKHLSASN